MDREYYYKDNRCRARSAYDVDCICWHAVDSGPQRVDSNSRPHRYTWRDRTCESREVLAVDGTVENPLVSHAVDSDAAIDVVPHAARVIAAEAEAAEHRSPRE